MYLESKRQANERYRIKYTKCKSITFFPGDAELLEWAAKQGAFATYMKRLIREDMEKNS